MGKQRSVLIILAASLCEGASASGLLAPPTSQQIYSGRDVGGSVVLASFASDQATNLIVTSSGDDASHDRSASEAKPQVLQVARASLALRRMLSEAGSLYSLDPQLLEAVIQVESNFNSAALSAKGAKGLMQLMPATASRFGVTDPFDPRQNVHGGARYLHWLLERFQNDLELTLAAYNAGEQAVVKASYRVPNFVETRRYVDKVLQAYRARHR